MYIFNNSLCNILDTDVAIARLLEKSFTLVSFLIELESFILATCASFHKNIFKNTVKLATSRGKNGEN